MLRMIEEINAADDAKLQTSFNAYDTCSGKSNFHQRLGNCTISKILIKSRPTSVPPHPISTNAAGKKILQLPPKFTPDPQETQHWYITYLTPFATRLVEF